MEEITFLLRVILGTIFCSAGYHKLRNFEEHILIIEDYKLLPKSWVKKAGSIEIILELISGGLLLIGVYQNIASFIVSGLLLTFCVAISVNLLRGRNEISCGCGGVVGNHQLSWNMVRRNIVLLLSCIWLFNHNNHIGSLEALLTGFPLKEVYGYRFSLLVLNSIGLFLIGMLIQKLNMIQSRTKELLIQDKRR